MRVRFLKIKLFVNYVQVPNCFTTVSADIQLGAE